MRQIKSLCPELRFVLLAFALLLVLTAGGCSKTVTTYVWQTPKEPTAKPEQVFPELNKNPNAPYFKQTAYIRERKNDKSLGIAFSGGGTRAAAATIGQLRALSELGWLQKTRYLSAVSGGSWGAMPFLFAYDSLYEDIYQHCKKSDEKDPDACVRTNSDVKQKNKELNKRLLGKYTKPCELTEKLLYHHPNTNELLYNMSHAHIGLRMPLAWLMGKADESYADGLQSLFLDRVGVTQDFFTFSHSVRDKIIGRNTSLKGMKSEFAILRPGMPFPIINAVLFSKRVASFKDPKPAARVFPLEITPLYVGMGKSFPRMGYSRSLCAEDYSDLGGGWIETFAYDSRPPAKAKTCDEDDSEKPGNGAIWEGSPCVKRRPDENECRDCREKIDNQPGQCTVELRMERNHFSLADAIAASGAAPQEVITSIPVAKHGFLENLGFPEFNYWPPKGRVFRGQEMASQTGDSADFDECSQAMSERKKKDEEDLLDQAHDETSFEKKPEYAHGDGGHYDNLGLLPLLSRQVENIIVFLNSSVKLEPFSSFAGKMYGEKKKSEIKERHKENDYWSPDWETVVDLEEEEKKEPDHSKLSKKFIEPALIKLFRKRNENELHTAVFKGGEEKLEELYREFMEDRRRGHPMIHCGVYSIDPNVVDDAGLRTRISEAYEPKICWVYLDAPENWFKKLQLEEADGQLEKKGCLPKKKGGLPQDVLADLYFGKGEFAYFPNYWTFVQGSSEMPGSIINLTQKQANALAELTAWTVCAGAKEMSAKLGLEITVTNDCTKSKPEYSECKEDETKAP